MGNPLLSILGANNASTAAIGNLSEIKQAMKAVQFAKNPTAVMQEILQKAIQNNPDVLNALELCKIKNPEEVFYWSCRKQNVDPNFILNQLR